MSDPFAELGESTSERIRREDGIARAGRRSVWRRGTAFVGVAFVVLAGTAIGHLVERYPIGDLPARTAGALVGSAVGAFLGLFAAARRLNENDSDEDWSARSILARTLIGIVLGGGAGSSLASGDERQHGLGPPFWFGIGFGAAAAIATFVSVMRSSGSRSTRPVNGTFHSERR